MAPWPALRWTPFPGSHYSFRVEQFWRLGQPPLDSSRIGPEAPGDFRCRLEALPTNHPSSPGYRADHRLDHRRAGGDERRHQPADGQHEARLDAQEPRDQQAKADRPREQGWKTVAEATGLRENWSSFDEAKGDLPRLPEGHVYHHIVEQCQAKNTRSRFDTRKINSTDNLAAVPKEINDQLNYHYARASRVTGLPPRDMLTGQPWEYHHEYGCLALDRAMKGTL